MTPRDPTDPAAPDDAWPSRRDAWAEADRAYEQKWTAPDDDADARSAAQADGDLGALSAEPDPFSPGPGYTPTVATPKNVSDAYVGGMAAAGPYIGLGVQIAASMVLFAGGGYVVDRWLGSSPWGILAGATLGLVGVFALIVRVAREADAESRRLKQRRAEQKAEQTKARP